MDEGTGRKRGGRAGREGAGRGNRAIDVGGRTMRDPRPDLARVGIHLIELPVALRFDPGAVDLHGVPLHALSSSDHRPSARHFHPTQSRCGTHCRPH